MKLIFALISMLLLTACSDKPAAETPQKPPPQELSGNHVWKTQTDAINKARSVEQTLLQSSSRAMEQADEQ